GRFAPLGQRDQLGGHLDRLGQRAETEQLETPAQRRRFAARTPVVEERERLRRVEIVVEHTRELLPSDLPRDTVPADEEVAKGLGLSPCLRDELVVEVDRLAPPRGHEVKKDRLLAPLVQRLA